MSQPVRCFPFGQWLSHSQHGSAEVAWPGRRPSRSRRGLAGDSKIPARRIGATTSCARAHRVLSVSAPVSQLPSATKRRLQSRILHQYRRKPVTQKRARLALPQGARYTHTLSCHSLAGARGMASRAARARKWHSELTKVVRLSGDQTYIVPQAYTHNQEEANSVLS